MKKSFQLSPAATVQSSNCSTVRDDSSVLTQKRKAPEQPLIRPKKARAPQQHASTKKNSRVPKPPPRNPPRPNQPLEQRVVLNSVDDTEQPKVVSKTVGTAGVREEEQVRIPERLSPREHRDPCVPDKTLDPICPESDECTIHDDRLRPTVIGTAKESLSAQCEGIVRAVNGSLGTGTPSESALMNMCSRQTTARLLGLMSQTPRDTLRSDVHGTITARCNVSLVTRKWEESFMREASGSERPCMHAESGKCFASMIPNNGVRDPTFALAEFYTEAEHTNIRKSGWSFPTNRRMCILCRRYDAYSRFLSCRMNGVSTPPNVMFNSIGNMVEIPGEYCVEDVFVSHPDVYQGVIVPMVVPCISDYVVISVCGLRHLRQTLARPEYRRSSFFF